MIVEIHYVFNNNSISIFAISEKGKVKDAQYDETNCLFMGSIKECYQYCKDNNLVIG